MESWCTQGCGDWHEPCVVRIYNISFVSTSIFPSLATLAHKATLATALLGQVRVSTFLVRTVNMSVASTRWVRAVWPPAMRAVQGSTAFSMQLKLQSVSIPSFHSSRKGFIATSDFASSLSLSTTEPAWHTIT